MRGITPDYVLWESMNGRLYSTEYTVSERQLRDTIESVQKKWDEMARRFRRMQANEAGQTIQSKRV